MTSSDDFKEQIKAGKILDALTLALSQAVELEITTWVASASDSNTQLSSSAAKLSKPGDRLRTRINILEGNIENEIGNQFIGSGPYKELRQFHQEQVTDSSKIIQNNLNSLQRLFGILVRMQQPNLDAPTLEPELSDDIGEMLPPADKVVERSIELSETNAATADSLAAYDAAELAQIPLEELEASPTTLASNPEASNLETNEDWGDLVEEEPSQSSLDLREDDDWGDFAEEELTPVTPAPSQSSLDLGEDEDWGDLVEAEPEPSPTSPAGSLEFSNLEDEEWEEFSPATATPGLEFSNLADEDWEELQAEYPPSASTLGSSSSNLETDEDWEELQADDPDPFAATSIPTELGLDVGIEEDWEEFAVEELEPYPAISKAVPTAESEEDEILADLVSIKEQLNEDRDYNIIEGEEEERFAETNAQMPGVTNSYSTVSDDSMAALFEEESSPSSPQPSTQADAVPGAQMSVMVESYIIEEALFSETPFDEELSLVRSPSDDPFDRLDDDFEMLAALDENDLNADLTLESAIVPPPPPPPPQNQPKNQSNRQQ